MKNTITTLAIFVLLACCIFPAAHKASAGSISVPIIEDAAPEAGANTGKTDMKSSIAAASYFKTAMAWAEKGNLDLALTNMDKAAKLNPSAAYIFYDRGKLWTQKGDLDKAIADFDKTIELRDGNANAYWRRGKAYTGKNLLGPAIADLNKAVEMDPANSEFLRARGEAQFKDGNLDGALADYNSAIKRNRNAEHLYYGRGKVWLAMKKPDEAIADFDKSIAVNPNRKKTFDLRLEAANLKLEQEKAAATATAVTTASPGQFGIHLYSFRKSAMADAGYDRLAKKYPVLLKDVGHMAQRADLGPKKGIYYRLILGPLTDKAAARQLCRQLKAKGEKYCQPVPFTN